MRHDGLFSCTTMNLAMIDLVSIVCSVNDNPSWDNFDIDWSALFLVPVKRMGMSEREREREKGDLYLR
jgi:hypothetical protein